MESLLRVALFYACVVYTSAHDQQQLTPLSQGQGAQPQVYIGGPGQAENGPAATTVCVEIRSLPYPICGQQIPSGPGSGPHQQFPQGVFQNQQNSPFKGSSKDNSPASQQAQQTLPSEQKPSPINEREMLVPQSPQWAVQPVFRSPVVFPQQQAIVIPKQYLPSAHQNTLNDGTLSMNCKVSGIKNPNFPQGSSQGFSNMPFRFAQAVVNPPNPPYKSNQMLPILMNMDGSSPQMVMGPSMPLDSSGRSAESIFINPYNVPMMKPNSADDQSKPSPDSVAEDNMKKIMELKKQIAELNKKVNTEHQQHQMSSGDQQTSSNAPQHSQNPPQANEQQPNKNMNQQQAPNKSPSNQGKSRS